MNWEDYKREFECDGSLRDMYIEEVSITEWITFLESIKSAKMNYEFFINSDKAEIPESPKVIFNNRENSSALLKIQIDGITIMCHFFDENEIEMDIDPREVKNESNVITIFEFMEYISKVLKKQILLTPENGKQYPIFICDDLGNISYNIWDNSKIKKVTRIK